MIYYNIFLIVKYFSKEKYILITNNFYNNIKLKILELERLPYKVMFPTII